MYTSLSMLSSIFSSSSSHLPKQTHTDTHKQTAVSRHPIMEKTMAAPCKRLFLPREVFHRHRRVLINMQINIRSRLIVQSVLTDKTSLDTSSSKSVYNDNWFDRIAINHLSQSLQTATGLKSKKSGYDGLVEAATMASGCFNPMQQRKLVSKTLEIAFPRPILSLIKTVMRPSKLAREYFAVFTTIFFAWLVGPCEVRESEIEGRLEKNVVYVPKCRFLEGTNCVGMCSNLCKMPSQAFIKECLGMSFTMVPNFDDMSCEMIFGQDPPQEAIDPAFTQPCYKLCKSKSIKRHQNCTN